MKTGLIHGSPNKPVKKQYYYHGILRDCNIQPDPVPFDPVETIEGEYIVVTFDYSDVTANSANLEGVLIVAEGVGNFIERGFIYGVNGAYDLEFHEDGSFPAGNYVHHVVW